MDKAVIVTEATAGIGSTIARHLSRNGFMVYVGKEGEGQSRIE